MKREMSQCCGIKQYKQRSYSKQARYNNYKQKRENVHTDGYDNTGRQKRLAKGRGKEVKIH
jgi:hypothetical protein